MISISKSCQEHIDNPMVKTAIKNSAQQTRATNSHSQKTCGRIGYDLMEQNSIEDSAQQTCVRDVHSQQEGLEKNYLQHT